jgi:hypothetical protein
MGEWEKGKLITGEGENIMEKGLFFSKEWVINFQHSFKLNLFIDVQKNSF